MIYKNSMVSVIVPNYNTENFVVETLKSIFMQTYSNYEVVIVDDCSKDKSVEIIKEYIKGKPRFKIIELKQNSGVAKARNIGMSLSKGKYVAFLDSDDVWYSDKLEMQVNKLLSCDAVLSFTAIEFVDESTNVIKNKRNIRENVKYKHLLRNNMIATSTVVVDRNRTQDFEMPLVPAEDYATWLMLLRNGSSAIGINRVLTKYRKRANSISSNRFKSIKKVFIIQIKFEKIGILKAILNTFVYVINAFRKHYL